MNKSLILLVIVLLPISLFSQEKPEFEKTTYASPEGKLYIQRDLGVYVWLSTSPDESSEKVRLQSEESAEYTNPMYLDVEGYNTLRSPSAVDPETKKTIYPLRDIVFEVYSDGKAPVTKIDYGESKPFVVDGKTYIMSDTKVTLSASDALSGLKSIYYTIDGKVYAEYTQPLSFTEEREYKVKYFAVDNVGNDEEIHEYNFVYDKTAPITSRKISVDEHEDIISARSTIELETADAGSGVKKIVYKINDGKEYTYTRPLRAANLPQGEHTLTYYAIDKVGNKEMEQTYTFYIDKTAPTIIEEIIGKTFFANGKEFSSGKSQLKLTAFDNKAGIKQIMYSINDGEYQEYTKPVFLSQSSGNIIIKTYAVDNVNNKSVSQTANNKTSIPYIDLSGPSLSSAVSGPKFTTRDTLFINSKTKVTLKAKDLESGVHRIEYSIDGSELKTYEEPFSLETEGVHVISFTGYDNVENTSSDALVVKVDNSGPAISYQFSAPPVGTESGKNEYPAHVLLYLSGTDGVVGVKNIKYGFDNLTPKLYGAPIFGFSAGQKLIKLTATDMLGNESETTIEFIIKE